MSIVPFGKYKGKPVTELLADGNYIKWAKESGVYDKLVLVNVVQQSAQQDSPTPEHNRFQNLFLEESFRNKFVDTFFDIRKKLETLYTTDGYVNHFGTSRFEMKTEVEFETLNTNWDVLMKVSFSSIDSDETEEYRLFRHEQDVIHEQKIQEFETEKVRRDKIYADYLVKFEEGRDERTEKYKQEMSIFTHQSTYCAAKYDRHINDFKNREQKVHRCDSDCFKNHRRYRPGKLGIDFALLEKDDTTVHVRMERPKEPIEKPLQKGYEDRYFERNHEEYIKKYEETINRKFCILREEVYERMFEHVKGYVSSPLLKLNPHIYTPEKIRSIRVELSSFYIACELKPTIGDEYPCILRKFKEQRNKKMNEKCYYVVAFQKLTAETVSYVQLQEIFGQSGIPIKLIDEDEASMRSRLNKLEDEKMKLIRILRNESLYM